ncbi:hypothetical protein [Ectopseudomonas mendocina]|uniref:hypothetical protein n=1 Tax=Ectopseudomonas mendocina TaxID=300 RepID=UPI00376EABA9
MTDRYTDQGFHLLHWAEQIEALCPQCSQAGLIIGNPHWRNWSAAFHCPSCTHAMTTADDSWRGPVLGSGRRPCGSCGQQWVTFCSIFDEASQAPSVGRTNCQHCTAENEVTLTFSRAEPVDHAIDPFFGLELALKEETRHGTIWAYNAEHLYEREQFIAARLRENSTSKWSYFARLPSWVKSAKNREMVLKAIARLQRRSITKPAASSENLSRKSTTG